LDFKYKAESFQESEKYKAKQNKKPLCNGRKTSTTKGDCVENGKWMLKSFEDASWILQIVSRKL
jgi:hypothetical protein